MTVRVLAFLSMITSPAVEFIWGDFPLKHYTISLQPEQENTAHAGLKSIHTGCFLHVLESAIHFTLQKRWLPSTWFVKEMWVAKNAWVLKKNWVELPCSFWFQKDLFTRHIKGALEIYFVCQGCVQFLNVSKQLFLSSWFF
jgi:hypothetical protein